MNYIYNIVPFFYSVLTSEAAWHPCSCTCVKECNILVTLMTSWEAKLSDIIRHMIGKRLAVLHIKLTSELLSCNGYWTVTQVWQRRNTNKQA